MEAAVAKSKRLIVLNYDLRHSLSTRDMAEEWNLKCEALTRDGETRDLVTLAANHIHHSFMNGFTDAFALNVEEETARQLLMKLRLQSDQEKVLAFWFDEEMEENVKVEAKLKNAIRLLNDAINYVDIAQDELNFTSEIIKVEFDVDSQELADCSQSAELACRALRVQLKRKLRASQL